MKKFILLFVGLLFLNFCTKTSPEVIVPTIPSYAGGWDGNMISNNQIVGKISLNANKDLIVTGQANVKVKGSKIVGTLSRPCYNLNGTFEAIKVSY